MLTCERCGAALPLNSEQCAYCGTVSEQARASLAGQRAQQQKEARHAAAQVAILRQTALSATEQAASRALLWGLLSFALTCLFPIPNALAWLALNRASRSAREAGVELPARAKVGVAIAAVTGLAALAFWVWVIISVRDDNAQVEARKAVLSQQITQHANTEQLDQPFACVLAESYLLTNGFAGSTSTGSFKGLNCGGALRVVKDRAELADFKLRTSSTSDMLTAVICFKRGERWFVDSAGLTSCNLGNAPQPAAPKP